MLPVNNKQKDSADIEGGPSKEAEVNLEDPAKEKSLEDSSLEERQKKIAIREEAVETKLKEIGETQEIFRKEWDEKTAEIDALKELHETPDDDLEDVDYEEDEDDDKEDKEDKEKPAEISVGTELNTGFEHLVKEEMKEEKDFREKILKGQARLERRFAENDLSGELNKAAETYPKMDKREVLLEVERDPSQDVLKLAQKSEEDSKVREDKIREDIKAELKNEAIGVKEETEKTETIPSTPVGESAPSRQEKSKDRWSQATQEAQGDLEEGL